MNIGCDLDGVIIDHTRNKQRLLKERGFVLAEHECTKENIKSLLNPEEYARFLVELYDEHGIYADEITHAKQMLTEIASLGHHLRIISRRQKSSAQALQWLETHGYLSLFPQSCIHFVSRDEEKEDICKQFGVDVHIDDTIEILSSLKTPRYKIFFNPPSAHLVQDHILPAKNWQEVYNLIAQFPV